jgi:hypothetical protein
MLDASGWAPQVNKNKIKLGVVIETDLSLYTREIFFFIFI